MLSPVRTFRTGVFSVAYCGAFSSGLQCSDGCTESAAFHDIFESSPTLTEVAIMYGSLTSAKWLVPLIADASLSCGLKEDVSENQLQFTAVAISNRYRWLKAGELMLFFFNFKAGFYERFYSHFDTQTIIRSFKSFLEERALAIVAHEREF